MQLAQAALRAACPQPANRAGCRVAPPRAVPAVAAAIRPAQRASVSASRRSSRCVKASVASLDKQTAAHAHASSSSDEMFNTQEFRDFAAAAKDHNLIPLYKRIFSDHLTPVLAYRCLVKEDDREAPSFLLESVVGGNQTGRFSFIGAQPTLEVVAKERKVTIMDHAKGTREVKEMEDPMQACVEISKSWTPYRHPGLPECFCGGWVGYTSYDTIRYVYKDKLRFEDAPVDDRHLPDIALGLYKEVVVFDQATKLAYAVEWISTRSFKRVEDAFAEGQRRLAGLVSRLQADRAPTLQAGAVTLNLGALPPPHATSNMTKPAFLDMIAKAKEHIKAGDIFQVVLGQRFERRTFADPFEVYRALRVVNPSPYMIYMQARGAMLVASSPEILCRVTGDGTVVNRPLAGTRKRGANAEEDLALEKDLLADEKERAEHVMLVDLGRNDVGRVAKAGSVKVERLMEIERYSHVMHISSTVTGKLLSALSSWDALQAALPAGTVSGAPKVRAMQIIDSLEPTRRGPYGGGVGFVSFTGDMDMALALRTMVVPTAQQDTMYDYRNWDRQGQPRREWVFHVQAGAGIVADSDPESEYQETVNKAAGLARAIDLAESAFTLPLEQ